VKLRGRAQAPDQSRGCTLSSRTRGDTTAPHGPPPMMLELTPPPECFTYAAPCPPLATAAALGVDRRLPDPLLCACPIQ
jgi:hypothetical protein